MSAELCEDEGCPHAGAPHVCNVKVETLGEAMRRAELDEEYCPCGGPPCQTPPGHGCGKTTQRNALHDSLLLAALAAEEEAFSAAQKWGPMNSAHEAYGVLLEEVDKLWDHVKTNQKRRDMAAMRHEAVQVAAMALRFVVDICDADNRK